MGRVDGSLQDGGLTAETLALQMGQFPVPGQETYPLAEPGSPQDLISGLESWTVASADTLAADRANIDDDVIDRVAKEFDILLERTQDDPVARARLIRAGMILAQPNKLLDDSDGGRQERLDEVTLLAAEYATARQGDQVIRTGVWRAWDNLPSGIDGGLLEAPLRFHIRARGDHSNHDRNFVFLAEGAIPDPRDNSGGGSFRITIPQWIDDAYGGHPHIGRRQIEAVAQDLDASLRSGEDAFLRHAGLVVALSSMRGLERGASLNVLDEYFSAEQVSEYLTWYDGYRQNPRSSFRRTLSPAGQLTIHTAVAAMRGSQTQPTQ